MVSSCARRPGGARLACRFLGLIALLSTAAEADAANKRWSNGSGSFVFNAAGNWTGGVTPGLLDVSQFGISGLIQSTYTVSFNNNATNQALQIEKDRVTLDLSSRQYTVTAATGIVVGNQSGVFPGRLTIINGTVNSSTNIDVGAAANTSGALIVGANGLISGAPSLNIGKLGNGFLTVQTDGVISSSGSTTIGVGNGITGTATVIGNGSPGSATLLTGTLNVGNTGTGTVNVQLGGLLQNSGAAVIGSGSLFTGAGTGTVNVTNVGSVWNSQGLLKVGDGGTGKVNITAGGTVNGTDNVVGAGLSGSSGEVNVDGTSSLWHNSGTLTVGDTGAGTLNITNQGVVDNSDGYIGNAKVPTSTGTVTVNGAGSRWTNNHNVTVGNAGTGTLNITAGGTVRNDFGNVGFASSGTVTVDGSSSLWGNVHSLQIGVQGEGTLSITGGGTVQDGIGSVGYLSGSIGAVTVNGAGSLWDNSLFLVVGDDGDGTLSIAAGGIVQNTTGVVGNQSSGTGIVTVDGVGSRWGTSDRLTVGGVGQGKLNITAGGHVTSNPGFGPGDFDFVAKQAGSTGLVTVDGDGSRWESSGAIEMGDAGNGTLEIINGGTVKAAATEIGVESSGTGHVTVNGAGSLLDTPGGLRVGDFGRGTLDITGGGVVQSGDGAIDGPADSPSAVIVSGPGSRWHNSNGLSVGISAFQTTARTGMLDITDGAIVTTDGSAFLGTRENTTGTVTVAGAGSTWEIGGQLGLGAARVNGNIVGVGTLRIQSGTTVNVHFNTVVASGFSLLSLEGGTLSTSFISFQNGATGDSNFKWASGTLHMASFDGDLVNQGGVLAPGDPIGRSDIIGNYNQLAGATLEIEIGGPVHPDFDDVAIGGSAFLGGDLKLTLVNGFVPGSADTFLILGSFNLFGGFANVANGERLTTTDGLGSFVVNYGDGSTFDPRKVFLSKFLSGAGIPGDYNQNGIVDAADYVVWRKNAGTMNSLPNDPIGGTIGQNQYNQWRARFGQTTGGGSGASVNAAVPEPATLLMLFVGVLAICTHRDREGS
jgi:T5SS/PEP-CTERM-associated repeat protein